MVPKVVAQAVGNDSGYPKTPRRTSRKTKRQQEGEKRVNTKEEECVKLDLNFCGTARKQIPQGDPEVGVLETLISE